MQSSSRNILGQNCSLNAFVSTCNHCNNNYYYYGNMLYWGYKTKILSQEMTHCLHSQLSMRFLGKNLRCSMHNSLSSQKNCQTLQSCRGMLHHSLTPLSAPPESHCSFVAEKTPLSFRLCSQDCWASWQRWKFLNIKGQVKGTLSQYPLHSSGKLCIGFLHGSLFALFSRIVTEIQG